MREELMCKKPASTSKILGCSVEYFKQYVSERFNSGMTWENWGDVWELDHIIPCAKFDLSKTSEVSACFHFSNFQPLMKDENRKKAAKILNPQQSLLLCQEQA